MKDVDRWKARLEWERMHAAAIEWSDAGDDEENARAANARRELEAEAKKASDELAAGRAVEAWRSAVKIERVLDEWDVLANPEVWDDFLAVATLALDASGQANVLDEEERSTFETRLGSYGEESKDRFERIDSAIEKKDDGWRTIH